MGQAMTIRVWPTDVDVSIANHAAVLTIMEAGRIDFMIRWHQQFMGKEYLLPDDQLNPRLLHETGAPNKYGLHRPEDLVETCLPRELLAYRHPRTARARL